MEINTNLTDYQNELNEIIRLFFPTFQENETHKFSLEYKDKINTINIDEKEYKYPYNNDENDKKTIKNGAKLALYEAMCKHFGKSFEWGDITGVRPTKIAYDIIRKGNS
jgi:oxygen-independent coproporphyrinogen-3 oxidase